MGGKMQQQQLIISEEKKGQILHKIHLECLKMNELINKHNLSSNQKEDLKEYLNWMHHLLKYYAHEKDLSILFDHYNWLLIEFNYHVKDHKYQFSKFH